MVEQPQAEKSIFLEALDIASPAERAAFLDRVCGENEGLRAKVEALLNAHERPQRVLDAPEATAPTIDEPPLSERPGTVIGHYKLLEQIGEGGMGTVYMAQQTEPVKRAVALKIIKPGMDTRQVIARFEAERQALALMDHPNIAKVLDAGTTGGEPGGVSPGKPYFVMELVKGVSITKYCDKHRLTPRQRLELFIHVCQAVQHAHQKGIIHRDLKPSNILVAQYDGRPVPKVIDFGVAKAAGQQLTDKTLMTGFGTLVGTLEYMSPEQAEINQLDIDTRSDIYSLGVVLYELLTGSTPLDRKRLKQAAFTEMLRIIREEEPPKPSTRLSDSTDSLPSISAQRHMEPAKLTRSVRGELDWIVMKALDKDRNRRYETANGFASDVQRYLHDEPVQACPPSVGYRLRKFVRRNRAVVAGTASAMVVLLLALLGLTISNMRITQEKALTKQQRDEAEANFRKARKAVDDQFTLVSQSTLFETPGFQSLRKDLLESALKYYLEFLQERPDDAELQAEVAAAYLRLYQVREAIDSGLSADAIQSLEKGIAIVEQLVREHPHDTEVHKRLAGFAKGNRNLHGAYSGRGPRADLDVALPLLERAAKIWEAFVRDNPKVIEFQNDLAAFYQATIDVQAAVGVSVPLALPLRIHAMREDLVRAAPQVPEYRNDLANSHSQLAGQMAWEMRGDFPFAEVDHHFRRTFELRKQLVDENAAVTEYRSELGLAHRALGLWLSDNGRFPEAEQAYGQMLIVQERLSAESPTVPRYEGELESGYWFLGNLLRDTGRPEKAEEAYRKSLSISEKLVAAFPANAENRGALACLCFSLGPLLAASNRAQEAEQLYRKALAFTPDGPDGHNTLAMLLLTCPEPKFRDPARALALAKKATELAPAFGYIWSTLGTAHYRAGNWKDALPAMEKAMKLGNGGDGDDWIFLAMVNWRLGDKAKSREWYDKAIQWMEKNNPPSDELRRQLRAFRAEAAELLGIKDTPKRK